MALPTFTGRSGCQPSIVDFYDPYVNGTDAHLRTREEILNWDDDKLERCHDYIQVLFPLPEGSMFSYNAPVIDKKTLEAFRSRASLQMSLSNAFVRMLQFYGFEVLVDLDPGNSEEQSGNIAAEVAANTVGVEKGENSGKTIKSDEPAENRKDSATHTTPADADDSGKPGFNTDDVEGLQKLSKSYMNTKEVWQSVLGFYVVRGPNFDARSKNWCVRMDHNHLRITRILRCLRVLGLQRQCEAFYKALKAVYHDNKINIGERSMMFWRRAVREQLHIAPDGTESKWLLRWQETDQTQD